MYIGYSIGLDGMSELDNYGLDYFETNLSVIAAMDEDEFKKTKEFVRTLKTPVKVCNVLLPGSQMTVGPDYNPESCRSYLHRALSRAKEIGVELIVFGSGAAKRIPEGFDRTKAMAQLCDFTRILAKTAAEYGLLITIEALRKEECNCINSLDESEWLCDRTASDSVFVLADWYHMSASGDTPARMEALGQKLRHVHLARPQTRAVSHIGDGSDYTEFFAALARMGYNGGISSEGSSENHVSSCEKYIALVRQYMG